MKKINALFFIYLIIFSLSNQSLYGAAHINKPWIDILTEKKDLIEKSGCQLLLKQFQEFVEKQSPIISDLRVKNIQILENNEPLIDIRKFNHPRIFMLKDPKFPFESDACNSGFSASSKVRVSVFEKLKKMIDYLDLLAEHFGYDAGSINIAVFEGLRDIKTQEMLFENKKNDIKKANPHLTEEELYTETCKWVSPIKNNIPVHSTGAAIDIRLMIGKEFVDCGKFGAIWGANPNAPTFSESITLTQKQNRLYSLMAACMAGLTNYAWEYWHISYGDKYYEYWKDSTEKVAAYGSVVISKL